MGSLDKKTVVVAMSVAVGLLLAGAAGVAHWTRASTLDALAEQEAELEMLREQLESQAQPSAAPATETSARWQLHSGPEVVTTMQTVQMLGDEAGVVFDKLGALRSADNGKQSFAIAGHGTPRNVCIFLASIEQDDRLMIVETGRLVPAGGDQVAFELGLATYHEGGW